MAAGNAIAARQFGHRLTGAALLADGQAIEFGADFPVAQFTQGHLAQRDMHIGIPYIDKLGKGAPLTVCNGITGTGVVAGKWYSPTECYQLEKGRYLQSERAAQRLLAYWASYDALVQGTFIDFLHNKGEGAFLTSTMRRKANAGDLPGACRENPRWNKGTVKGISTVLPGLQLRGDSNDEICRDWRMGTS